MLAAIVCFSLITIDVFGAPSLFSIITTILSSSLLLFIVLILLPPKHSLGNVVSLPILLFSLLIFYLFFSSLVRHLPISIKHYLLFAGLCVIVVVYLTVYSQKLQIKFLFTFIIIAATLESITCVWQYFSIIPSANPYFKVTGSWVNPNVTAMFLALTTPILLNGFFENEKRKKIVHRLLLCLTIIAQLLLNCRTAWMGSLVSMIVFVFFNWYVLDKLKSLRLPGRILVLILGLVILYLSAMFIYFQKKNSSEGRLFIWSQTLKVIKSHPVLGVGLGKFEQTYNIQQANYFKNINSSTQNKANARYVKTAYNDFLELTAEGGMVALILYLVFWILIFNQKLSDTWCETKYNEKSSRISILSFSGLASFLVMSLFNFAILAIPAFFLFCIYLGVFLATSKSISRNSSSSFNLNLRNSTLFLRRPVFILIGFFSLIIFFRISVFGYSMFQVKRAAALESEKQFSEALEILEPLQETLSQNEVYLQHLSYVNYRIGDSKKALRLLNQAKELTSDPFLYIHIGQLYSHFGELDLAESHIRLASDIQPTLLTPYLELARISLKRCDTSGAIYLCRSIINDSLSKGADRELIKSTAGTLLKTIQSNIQ